MRAGGGFVVDGQVGPAEVIAINGVVSICRFLSCRYGSRAEGEFLFALHSPRETFMTREEQLRQASPQLIVDVTIYPENAGGKKLPVRLGWSCPLMVRANPSPNTSAMVMSFLIRSLANRSGNVKVEEY